MALRFSLLVEYGTSNAVIQRDAINLGSRHATLVVLDEMLAWLEDPDAPLTIKVIPERPHG